MKALERLLVGIGVYTGWLPCPVNGHCCENLNVAACASFIGFGECVRLALLAVCSGDPACRIDRDFEFLPAPVGLDIQDRVDEIAGCSGFVRSGAEPCGLAPSLLRFVARPHELPASLRRVSKNSAARVVHFGSRR